MIRDVAKWLMLVAVLVLAFAAAFRTIFNAALHTVLSDECAGVDTRMGAGLGQSAMLLMEQLLGTDPLIECFALSKYAVTATFFIGLYLMLAVVLLVNMLIAMCASIRLSCRPRP